MLQEKLNPGDLGLGEDFITRTGKPDRKGAQRGWRSLVGYSPWGRKELDTTEQFHFHFQVSQAQVLSQERA